MANETIMRFQIADYLGIPGDSDTTYALMGAGYKIGRDELTGADAERDYIRVELFEPVASKENTFKARKFRVAVEVASCAGAGGETIKVTGNLNNVGTFVDGEFNTTTKTFTEAGAAESV